MANLAPQYQRSFTDGMVSGLNSNIAPQGAVDLLLNLDEDYEIGSATSRLGTAIVDAQLVDNVSILGIVQHVDQADSTKNKLFASVDDAATATNADIWDLDGTPAKSLQDDTKALKVYFLNYNGDTLRLNGTDAPKAYNSTSWITTGGVFDLANMPTGYKYPKEFLDRVYLWGNATTPYRLAYSGLLTTGTVSWTSGNGTVDIEPEDNGGAPTGLGKVPGYILIFKKRSMHRWNYSSAFPENLVQIGAYSQESIIEAGGLCAFYSDSNEDTKGFYITNGGRPECISQDTTRPIKKWTDAISSTANVAGFATERSFNWSVGDLTIDGETFSNVVLRYNRFLKQWSVRTYPSEFKCFAPYVVSGVNTIVGGDDDGTVYRIDKSATYSDNGTAISYKLRQVPQYFGYNQLKELSDKIIVRGKNLEDAKISVIQNDDLTDIVSLGQNSWWKKLLAIVGLGRKIKGNCIAVQVDGQTSANRVHIREIEIPSLTILPNYND